MVSLYLVKRTHKGESAELFGRQFVWAESKVLHIQCFCSIGQVQHMAKTDGFNRNDRPIFQSTNRRAKVATVLVKVQFPEMQLRLIERIIDEGVVTPDVHERILCKRRY